ncbi:MAG: repeat containing protein [Cyanobacteria bacterium RYN_339]|nr:repeat containing protein [Cyanobacteria bacterium RYN_339]
MIPWSQPLVPMRPHPASRTLLLAALALGGLLACNSPVAKAPVPTVPHVSAAPPIVAAPNLGGLMGVVRVPRTGLLSTYGNGILSDAAAGVISDAGGSVISNNGGAFRLLGLDEACVPLAGAAVEVFDEAGTRLTTTPTLTDAAGRYQVGKLDPSGARVVVKSSIQREGQDVTLVAIAAAPRGSGAANVPLDPATTLVALKAQEMVRRGVVAADALDPVVLAALAAAIAPHMTDKVVAASVLLPAATSARVFDAVVARPDTVAAVATTGGGPLVGRTPPEGVSPPPATPTPGQTPAPGQSPTPTPAPTPAPGQSPTPTPGPTPTPTATPFGATPTPAPTPTPTPTPVPVLLITAYAGNGVAGAAGDGAAATAAQLNGPYGLAFDPAGNLYIADSANNKVRKVTPGGIISTFAGTGTAGSAGDGGAATAAQLSGPGGVAADASGNLYIADTASNKIRKVTPGGIISTVAGTGVAGAAGDGGAATAAQLKSPTDVKLDAAGNLYIVDYANHKIRKVAPGGTITTIAGTGTAGSAGDGGAATAAQLNLPYGAALDAAGAIYIADQANHKVRKIAAGGTISTLAGTGAPGATGDGGPATSALLTQPTAVAVDAAGNVYVTDTGTNVLRKIAPGGTISAVAGTGTAGGSGDGGPAAAALLNSPTGLTVDAAGNLYISDYLTRKVRKLSF